MQELGKKIKKLCFKLDALNQYANMVNTVASGIAVILTIAKDYLVNLIPFEEAKVWANFAIVFLIIVSLVTIIAFSLLAKLIADSKESFISDAFNYLEVKDALNNYQNLFQETDKHLRKTKAWIVQTINCFIAMQKVLESSDNQEFKKRFDEMIKEVIYPNLKLVWGSSEEEVFTIAVYLYNPATGNLEDFSSRKDPWMNKEKKGRAWRPGQGHIGLVFDTKKAVVHDSIHDEFKPAPDNQKESDLMYYNSTITLPIRINNDDDMLRGVFCITSSLKSAFKSDTPLLNETYKSREYALLLVCCYIEKMLDHQFGEDLTKAFYQVPDAENTNSVLG